MRHCSTEELQPLKARVVEMVNLYEQALEYVKEAQDQEVVIEFHVRNTVA